MADAVETEKTSPLQIVSSEPALDKGSFIMVKIKESDMESVQGLIGTPVNVRVTVPNIRSAALGV